MTYRYLTAGTALASALLVASAAAAMPGTASGDVNMRSGPGTQYAVITTIPAGAPLEVFDCQNWCEVAYAGNAGLCVGPLCERRRLCAARSARILSCAADGLR